jgi:hypothetical protein
MDDHTKRNCAHLLYVLNAPRELRLELLNFLSDRLVTTFCEIVLNTVELNMQVEDADKLIIKKYEHECRTIIRRAKSVARKRTQVAELSGELLDALAIVLARHV